MRDRPVRDNMEHIRKVVEKALRRERLWTKVHSYEVFAIWYDVFGEDVTERLRPEAVHGDTLHLVAVDSTWAHEFFLMQRTILKKLNDALGQPLFRHLRLRPGTLPDVLHVDPILRPPSVRSVPIGISALVEPGPLRDILRRMEEEGEGSASAHRR